MIQPGEMFRSVEHIWLLWLASCVTLTVLLHQLLRRFRWHGIRPLALREEGAAYSMVYVLTVPFYMFVICLVVESSLILIAKIGTVYAAYAGARALIVWQNANPNERVKRTQQAIAQAMAPFASGDISVGAPPDSQDVNFATAYHQYSPSAPGNTRYLQNKYQYAWKYVPTETALPPINATKGDELLTVTFKYEAPIHTPIIGKLIGHKAGSNNFYSVSMTTSVTLQDEGSKAKDFNDPSKGKPTELGIPYQSIIE